MNRPQHFSKFNPNLLQHHFNGGPAGTEYNKRGKNFIYSLYTHYPAHDGSMYPIGAMHWHPETGELKYIEVHRSYRRKGVATAMWSAAKKFSESQGAALPTHSDNRTPVGTDWAKSTRDTVPPIASGVCRTCSELRDNLGNCQCTDYGPPHLFG